MRRYTTEECEQLAASSVIEDRRKAAMYAATPEASLLALVTDQQFAIRRTVAKRKRNPDSVWVKMLEYDSDSKGQKSVLACAGENVHCPEWVLDQLAESKIPLVRRIAVGNPLCSPETLKRILAIPFTSEENQKPGDSVFFSEFSVKKAIISNPNLPVETLLTLIEEDEIFRHEAANNPSFPVQKMWDLVDSETNTDKKILNPSLFLRNIARNKNCPLDLLNTIIERTSIPGDLSSDLITLYGDVITNMNCNEALLSYLHVTHSSKVSRYVYLNQHATLSMLEDIASNGDVHIYYRVIVVRRLNHDPKYAKYPLEWLEAFFLG